jgi:hypothetical protein
VADKEGKREDEQESRTAAPEEVKQKSEFKCSWKHAKLFRFVLHP